MIALGDSVRSRFEIRQQARLQAEQTSRAHERDTRLQVEQERLRIAREVHDVLAHSVSAISIQSVVGLEALPDEPDNAAAALRSIRGVSTRRWPTCGARWACCVIQPFLIQVRPRRDPLAGWPIWDGW